MSGRLFLDSNVLVYAVDARYPAQQKAARALLARTEAEACGVISTQVLQEFYSVATRKLGLTPQDAGTLVELWSNFETVVVDVPMIRDAVALCRSDQLNFWDALIVVAAAAAHCEVLCTEDLSDGRSVRGVRIANPFTAAQSGR